MHLRYRYEGLTVLLLEFDGLLGAALTFPEDCLPASPLLEKPDASRQRRLSDAKTEAPGHPPGFCATGQSAPAIQKTVPWSVPNLLLRLARRELLAEQLELLLLSLIHI